MIKDRILLNRRSKQLANRLAEFIDGLSQLPNIEQKFNSLVFLLKPNHANVYSWQIVKMTVEELVAQDIFCDEDRELMELMFKALQQMTPTLLYGGTDEK